MNVTLLPKSVQGFCKKKGILYLEFSKDRSEILVGLEKGYKIMQVNPFSVLKEIKEIGGGIGIIKKFQRVNNSGSGETSNLVFVGGGTSPAFISDCRINVYSGSKNTEITKTSDRILNIRVVQNFHIVMMLKKIVVFETSKKFVRLAEIILPRANPFAIADVAIRKGKNGKKELCIAFPSKKVGVVQVEVFDFTKLKYKKVPDQKKTFIAHESAVCNICFNPDCTELATSSSRATLVRTFTLVDGKTFGDKKKDFRRGLGGGTTYIWSIAYSPSGEYLAAASSNGTIHIFRVQDKQPSLFSLQRITGGIRAFVKVSITKSKNDKAPVILRFLAKDEIGVLNVYGEFIHICLDYSQKEEKCRVVSSKYQFFL